MLDEEENLRNFKFFAVAFVMLLFAGYASFQELKYVLWGNVTPGEVIDVMEVTKRGRYGSETKRLEIRYTYNTEDGQSRNGACKVDMDWEPPGEEFEIQFISGDAEQSRIAGEWNSAAVILFTVCLGVFGFFGYQLWKMAHDAVHGKPKSRYSSRR